MVDEGGDGSRNPNGGQPEAPPLRTAIERAAAQWRTTFDAIASPILNIDAEGRVSRLNEAARRLTGLSYQQVIGRPAAEVGGGPLFDEAVHLAAEVRRGRTTLSVEVRDVDTGTIWDVSAHYRVASEEAVEEQVVVVARDITRVVELQESLKRSEVLSALGTLVAGVAHQVRNPLFGITAALDALEARFGSQVEIQRYAAALREPVERLTRLLRQLLDYAKPVAVEHRPTELREVVEAAVRACSPLAAGTEVSLVSRWSDLRLRVMADRERLREAVVNLLENALQHAPPGSDVEILGGPEDDAGGAWALLEVRDHGPGIPPEDVPRLLEPFFHRRHGGTGLGLALVHRIVEEHGGTVSVVNAAGGGALATMRLPLAFAGEERSES